MNLSGVAVGAYANFYHIDPDDIAVIQDDMDMPVGQLRIRRKGSAGGHNGIKSITEHLGTDAYPRFKSASAIRHAIIRQLSTMYCMPFRARTKPLSKQQ